MSSRYVKRRIYHMPEFGLLLLREDVVIFLVRIKNYHKLQFIKFFSMWKRLTLCKCDIFVVHIILF